MGTTLLAVIFTAIFGEYGHLVRRNLDVRAVFWLGGLILELTFLWPAIRMAWEGAGAAGHAGPTR